MIISTPSKFLLEISTTPIYQRIIEGLRLALLNLGHNLIVVDPQIFSSLDEYILFINKEEPDFLLLTNSDCLMARYFEDLGRFAFEKTYIPVIFIHHDNIFVQLFDSHKIQERLVSFYRTKDRCWHFCLEYENFLDLRSLGIDNTFSISHASEFIKYSSLKDYEYEVSFLGHVTPNFKIEVSPFSHFLQSHIWRRIVSLDTKLAVYATEFATSKLGAVDNIAHFLSYKYLYVSLVHYHSLNFRGEILKRIDNANVNIIGGDSAYIHGKDRNLAIEKKNIRYHPAQHNSYLVQKIYQNSQINLNITTLQFDDAVINRVIDIAAVGGFVLTDWRSDLEALTGVHQEISYKSIEELNEKIAYYSHSDHYQERIDIAEALHQDVHRKCNYLSIVQGMISKINTSAKTMLEPLRIDLGCGICKPDGFIGVDISPGSNVDVVANLNRRFPFSDSSADLIRASSLIEHLDDPIHTMNELWRVAKPDGMIDIRVPSTDGRGAFQDPTHVSFWNINSFMYYCVEYPDYLKICQTYGFKGAFRIESMEHERSEGEVVIVHTVLRAVKECIEEKYREYSDELKKINILICPDWQEDEASLFKKLCDFFSTVFQHSQKQDILVLIGTNENTVENIGSLLSDIVLNLIFEKNIDASDGEPNIVFLPMENHELLRYLIPRISKVIDLANTDLENLALYN